MKNSILIILCLLANYVAFSTPNPKIIKKKHPQITKIINGTTTSAPFQVLLGSTSNPGGGMIIAGKWILTAGHTVTSSPVYVGVTNRNSLPTPRTTLSTHNHPSFSQTPNPSNDIGLIQLSQPISFNSTIAPIKLASSNNASLWNTGQSGYVYGFGQTNSGSLSQVLLRTNVNLQSNASSIAEKKIYATGPGTNDACNGDSGGPLTNLSNPGNSSTVAIGVVSSNLAGGAGAGCGGGGKYTKIADYLQWIIETIHFEGSPQFICGNTTFSNLSILPDGVSFTWTASPANLFTNSTGSGLTFTTAQNGNNKGWGTVSLKVNLPNGTSFTKISKQIWIGNPDNISLTTDGTFSIIGNNASICKNFGYCLNSSAINNGKTTATSFTYSGWPISNAFLNTSTISTTNDKVCFGSNNTGSYYLTIYANNGSCSIGRSILVQVNSCGYKIASNPAQTTLSILFESPQQLESIPDNIDLYDEKQKAIKSVDLKQKKKETNTKVSLVQDMEKIELDVKDLPRGIYYLHLTFGNNNDKHIEEIKILLN